MSSLNTRTFFGALSVLLLSSFLAGCPGGQQQNEDAGVDPLFCEVREDCEVAGQICTNENYCSDCETSGQCRLKEECRAAEDTGEQRCELRSGWGSECELNSQCPAGRWCVQGLCKDTSLVRLCPNGSSAECLSSERCNAQNLVCEEDLGCAENADCSAAEVCNTGSHQCVPKCTAETQADVCAGGERCVNEKCVQCESDNDCGVGLKCDPAGRCVAQEVCYTNRDCKVPLVCYAPTGQCVTKAPPCVSDENCAPDQKCNVGTGKCVPRACQPDIYEPNNERSTARAMTPNVYYGLTLCENDVDFFAFNLSRGDQLGINVDADPFAENTFTTVVQDATGRTLASGRLLTSFVAATPETYYVGISTTDPYQPYDVRFLLSRGTPCDDDTWEPNDSLAQPTPVNMSGFVDGAICPQDVDHFEVNVPSSLGITARLTDYNSANGLLQLCLFEGGTELACSEDQTLPVVSASAAQAGGKPVVLRILAVDPRAANSYTLQIQF